MNLWLLAGTTFLASSVEAVEALTIVLAVGITRSWRIALQGAALGLLALVAMVVALGPTLRFIPLDVLEFCVGALLLLFGLAWLRKAILRYAGRKSLKDEDAIYAREVGELRAAGERNVDRVALATAFNAVLLEGLEVVVIVVTFGAASAAALTYCAIGALVAVALVCVLGFIVRKPASRVPENLLKFVVGIMLTSFGTFWTGEGLGIEWWHADASLFGMIACYFVASLILIRLARRRSQRLVRA